MTTITAPHPYTLELYLASDGPRWRLKRKGRIVANSGEAYKTKSKLRRAADGMMKDLFRVGGVNVVDNLKEVEK